LTGGNQSTGTTSGFHRAAALVRELPIRWSANDPGGSDEKALARGWFHGADECARILADHAARDVSLGNGFGGPWPLVWGPSCVIAPALPVVVEKTTTIGADGEYRLVGKEVWREAVGADDCCLVAGSTRNPPGAPFDLLWFGEGERCVVRGGILEIEDLFGRLRVPAEPRLLERILIRGTRRDRGVLSSLPTAAATTQKVEVRRPAALGDEKRVRDAAALLAARADVERVHRGGSVIEARLAGGRHATFGLEEDASGWQLVRCSGDFVFTELRLDRSSSALSLSATLDPHVDALAPGMRGRLIFDLRSDLVALD
jgi:hypothetical protein